MGVSTDALGFPYPNLGIAREHEPMARASETLAWLVAIRFCRNNPSTAPQDDTDQAFSGLSNDCQE